MPRRYISVNIMKKSDDLLVYIHRGIWWHATFSFLLTFPSIPLFAFLAHSFLFFGLYSHCVFPQKTFSKFMEEVKAEATLMEI